MKESGGKDYFGYFPTIAESNHEPDRVLYLKFPEILYKRTKNQVELGQNKELTFTDFQSTIYRLLRRKESVTFSAPTSAGKSYVILNYIVDRLYSLQDLSVVYVVPTKALMSEIQDSIIATTKNLGFRLEDYSIFTSANSLNAGEISRTRRKVFILTQERLQDAVANQSEFRADILVVDEAQKVADGGRGVVIEDAVQELVGKNPGLQKIFISPYISNPAKFAQIFGVQKTEIQERRTSKSPVGQVILFVDFKKKVTAENESKIDVEVFSQEFTKQQTEAKRIKLGYEYRGEVPETGVGRKAWVAIKLIEGDEPTLIYCDRPADCRNVGKKLSEEFEQKPTSTAIAQAIDFLKQHVHEEYYLVDLLKFGIGYHYGRMPQFVRFQVKELFEKKEIRYLCCTSTLLEGVNLPAKNLVLYNPKAGSPMKSLLIKNLIGRAGRLQKDYYGKIFCINVKDWKAEKDAFEDKPEMIESSSEETLSKHADELIRYLQSTGTMPAPSEGVKSLATSLLMKQLRNPLKDFLSDFKGRHPSIRDEDLNSIRVLLLQIANEVSSLDREVILKNRSIDPRFQYKLYLALRGMMNPTLPVYPGEPNFYGNLQTIFSIISRYLLGIENNSFVYFTFLASSWISAKSYKQILDDKIEWERTHYDGTLILNDKKDYKTFVNKVIDKLDEELEERIKYDYSRALKCYCDIVGKVLEERHRSVHYANNLHLYLEAGASSNQVLMLLGVGLSRNTAIQIAHYAKRIGEAIYWADTPSVILWLRAHEASLSEFLEPILYEEIKNLLY